MATLQDIQSQYQQTLQNMQAQLASAQANQNVGSWGGSSADAQHWQQVAADLSNQIQQIQQNYSNAINQVNQLGLQNDPQTLNQLTSFLQNNGAQLQSNQLNTYLTQQAQAQYQQQQLSQLTQQQQAAAQQARTQMLAQIPDEMNALNTNLVNTEQQAMTQLQPQIDQRLNALGLLQSGALPQAYAQAQTGLDIARENQLNQFQLNAMNQVGTGIPLSALQSQLGNMQQAAQGNIDLSQQGAARNYSLSDVSQAEAYQQQQMQNALYAARQNQGTQNNTLGQVIGGLGAAASLGGTLATGNPMFLAGLPSSVGAIAGGGQGAQMGSQLSNPMMLALMQQRNFYGTGQQPAMSGTGSGAGLNLSTTPIYGGF